MSMQVINVTNYSMISLTMGRNAVLKILRSCVNVSDSITKLSVRMLDTEWFQVIQWKKRNVF